MSEAPLVLVSNRGPVTFEPGGVIRRGSGGLVTALIGLATHVTSISNVAPELALMIGLLIIQIIVVAVWGIEPAKRGLEELEDGQARARA